MDGPYPLHTGLGLAGTVTAAPSRYEGNEGRNEQ